MSFQPRMLTSSVTLALSFQSGSVGALVMVDVLHHLPKPLEFLAEAGRVLSPGGRLAMIEPWITVPSYLLYRYFHHEDCSLAVDVRRPFDELDKRAFDGNAAIPFKLLKHFKQGSVIALAPDCSLLDYPIWLPWALKERARFHIHCLG